MSAPRCHNESKKFVNVRLSLVRVRVEFGSKTAHWIAASIAFSIIIISRRTLTYRQSVSLLTVRAPKMRRPRPGNGRIALMPTGFKIPCTASSTKTVTSSAQISGALAGALCTPN